jgi:transcriptional/translational regulatory protein YebC/TACO1
MKVRKSLVEGGFRVKNAELQYVPNVALSIEDDVMREKIMKLLDALDDLDDVSNVSTNAEL